MASRAIVRRLWLLSDYLNVSVCSVQSFQNLGHGQSRKCLDSNGLSPSANNPSQGLNGMNGGGAILAVNDDLLNLLALGFLRRRCYGTTTSGCVIGSDDEDNEDLVAKKRNAASPEECDQAVEGLSTAKAKGLQGSQKGSKFVLQRKDEIVSTLQHYWLGFKLLWTDVRISSRLLLKLASGKTLSRRQRQRLTRTTTNVFRLVPFAVFIIIPFMEFLLPVFLKLFPSMLPSTFQDKMKEQVLLGS
ncbi:hypothetical protein TEA_001254 [Camellia sinensis var. sinensis]|uniref:Letm1 RBD domain-containing protein n=1 Tax=Camellia sinensis var. sinensis TaxID=542762 RepID=A0A4S4ESP3_CAMSN|nr:hypothetical protein TEA_001254 [Camellia sinensis var. sinensis]